MVVLTALFSSRYDGPARISPRAGLSPGKAFYCSIAFVNFLTLFASRIWVAQLRLLS